MGISRGPPNLLDTKELGNDEFTEAKRIALEGSVWRKLDRRVLPTCTMFYLLSFLDRSNVANARLVGLQKSLEISSYEYSVALTVTYVPYIVAEFPSNMLLKRIGPNVMLPIMITAWGLVSTLEGVVHNYSGLLACRFFLGLMEGGLFPGLVLYLSFFYPRTRLQIRVATFFASASLSGAFSGLLAAAIDEINGKSGRPHWAWIFILAHFLSEEERAYVVSRLKEDGAVSQDDKNDSFSWREVIESARSPHVWLLAIALFFNGTTLYSLAYFEPTIVAGLGYVGNLAQLMSVPPFAAAFVCSMVSALVSDRYHCRGWTAIFFSILEVIGFSMFYASESPHVRYGSLFFSIVGAYCVAPALSTWMANNSAPYVRRATSVAIAFIMTNAGGILATWLLGSLSPPPGYTKATITFIIMSIGMVVFSAVNLVYLSRTNSLKAERRHKMTTRDEEPAGLGDRSAWFIYSL
ncbi:major facilitator superfamily domain-containing protein [Boletus edulis]|nr:major facilitator superfamily domain-containing protein [Boletus edulis]